MDYELYTDGGGNQITDHISAACIVIDKINNKEYFLGSLFRKGTNNEAEVLAGLLGLSLIHALNYKAKKQESEIIWYSDSEYALNSATKFVHRWERNNWIGASGMPVKNKGLWLTYLSLSEGITIHPKHVKGHSETLYNNVCDNTCTWIRKQAIEKVQPEKPYFIEPLRYTKYKKVLHETNWLILDGREWIDNITKENPILKNIIWASKLLISNIN